jgi:hypothetical protein
VSVERCKIVNMVNPDLVCGRTRGHEGCHVADLGENVVAWGTPKVVGSDLYDARRDFLSEARYEPDPQSEPDLSDLRGNDSWWNGAEK